MKNSKKLIYGVGINDADYPVVTTIGKNRVTCPFYQRWRNMIRRCYSEKSLNLYPTYKSCSVCDEWLIFSNFKKWMELQDWENKELDKDILDINNKIYSPEKCLFVSREINALIVNVFKENKNTNTGITFEKKRGIYKSSCSVRGKMKTLGRYDNIIDARRTYLNFKSGIILEYAKEIEEIKLKNALIKISEYISKHELHQLR